MMKERDRSIDILKGILVIGMVLAHCFQFFSELEIFKRGNALTQYINLITFPGFVFCFGYVTQAAYLCKPYREVWHRIVFNAMKTLMAYYISGLAFVVFVNNRILGKGTIKDVLLLKVIPGWSEFIISFTLYMFIVALLYKVFKWMLENRIVFFIGVVLLFAATFIPYDLVKGTLPGLLIGTREFPCFPVLQYMPFFLMGMYFKRYEVVFNPYMLTSSFLMTLVSGMHIMNNKGFPVGLPERFPPSIYWIMAPAFIIYSYYLACRLIERLKISTGVLESIGSNTIVYLLLSNIFIFSLESKGKLQYSNEITTVLISATILGIIYFILDISVKRKLAKTA